MKGCRVARYYKVFGYDGPVFYLNQGNHNTTNLTKIPFSRTSPLSHYNTRISAISRPSTALGQQLNCDETVPATMTTTEWRPSWYATTEYLLIRLGRC